MTTEQTATLVLKDSAGSYYLVSQETLERGRVPAEHTAALQQMIAEQQDTQGHFLPIPWTVVTTGAYIWALTRPFTGR